jgi:hypothetical protein
MITTASPNSAIPGEAFRASHPTDRWGARRNGHWAAYDRDGNRLAVGADWCTAPTAAELEAWDAEAQAAAARVAAWPVDVIGQALYIRFGRLPRAGRSRNYATGQLERGVSVYRARYNARTDALDASSALAGTYVHYLIAGKRPYLVAGDEVGTGSDGEPVLANARVVAELVATPDGFRIA